MAVVPTDRRTTWKPGIYGGIPPDDANASTFPNGVGPCTQYGSALSPGDNIQTALNSAGAVATKASRRFVKLNAGTFSVGSQLSIPSYVTLRGTKGSNGASPTTILDQTFTGSLVSIWGGSGTWGTVRSVSGTHSKGGTTITVDNATDFAVGDILCIDQIQDGTNTGPSDGIAVYNVPSTGNWVWLLSSLWYQRQDYDLGHGVEFMFPDCETGLYRPISQRFEVLSKNGNVLTIHNPNATICGSPLHVTYYNTPQVYRSGGTGDVVRYAGLEDVRIYPSGTNGQRVIILGQAAFCWVRGVEVDGSTSTGNTWSGRHLEIYCQSYRCEVRECYFHESSNYNQGGNAYGIDYQGSECLIENNIVMKLNKPIVGENSGGGNVIAYNYVDEAVITNLTNNWQEAAISTHASFCHSDLFEGNWSPNLGSDATHGNNGWLVIYRNYAPGRNSSGNATTYCRAIFSDGWNREITSVGNVLWNPNLACDYQILTPDDGINPVYNSPEVVYLLGSNAWNTATGAKPGADYWDNGQAADLFYRHMDFDYESNDLYENPANGDTTLPNSMYLTGKPSWWGSYDWPWVDPTQSTHATRVKTLPAKARYDASTPFLELQTPAFAKHSSGRYIVDIDGNPVLVHGDTCWSIAVQLTESEVDQYLDDRQNKGVNAILFSAIEHEYSDNTPPERNAYGEMPFTSTDDFGSPNEAYWSHVDYIVDGALARGMACIINPAYLGYSGGSQGWTSEINAESAGDLESYGAFLANRYTQGNIIWSFGGDYDGDATLRAKQRNIQTGIRSIRTTDLVTFHPSPNEHALEVVSTTDYPNFVNWSYCYEKDGEYVYAQVAQAYAASGPVPVLLMESQYEGEHSTTAAQLRRQSYTAMLSGTCGQFFGNNPIWLFASGWETALGSTGSIEQQYVKSLFANKEWWKLEPKTDTSLVSSSLSTNATRLCPALASDDSFAMIYVPSSQTVTCVMSALSPSSVRARLYDPTAGTYAAVSGSPFANTGSQNIATGGERIIVLDANPAGLLAGPANVRWRPA